MADTPAARHALLTVERFVAVLVFFFRKVAGRVPDGATAKIFNAVRHQSGISINGRVLAAHHLPGPRIDDSAWINFKRMIKQWITHEQPGAPLDISWQDGQKRRVHADGEGYFTTRFELPPDHGIPASITVAVANSDPPELSQAPVLSAGANARFLVVSDVDDTVLQTGASSFWTMLRTTLFRNELTRTLVEGIGPLYQALRDGVTGREDNPFFYVTSSPWNLEGFLKNIFDRTGLPQGAFFMTDWGLDREKWFHRSHEDHKTDAIRRVLAWHPHLPAILLGDSGQRDPEIYTTILSEFPDRIAAILIRDAARKKTRDADVEALLAEAASDHTPCLLTRSTEEATIFLRDTGWIA
ncbi:DUF2183 domain-containing protein [soil metagenome]